MNFPLPLAPMLQNIPTRIPSPTFTFLSSTQTILNPSAIATFNSIYQLDPAVHTLIYKPVSKKVQMVPAPMVEEYCIISLPDDPLAGLQPLSTHQPELDLDPADWLWPEELKLVTWLVSVHEPTFAWDIMECGHPDKHYFLPVKIPMIPHTPWVQCNIPIPSMIHAQVIDMIKDHIKSSMYEPSTAAYCSCWFCVVKKDRKSLCLVHDLQPLNAVIIHDMSIPPFIEHLTEYFAGYAVYVMMDLYSRYDQHALHVDSHDLTTIGTCLDCISLLLCHKLM
ncbi:hypothetical protein BKA82DRAFT_133599 [Pisolithus tinctorius]|uniref:Reverse transcriptase domain-containing protein n=1 Tax=Pisolithus tinctorius Marx 270 TaxID=870435 RepID=A0A0C3JIM8_PISTI|nr:hypothetical protein BKA82DRAFT_133599 [Pisolithus tinctorius]KIO08953.1 hypothetical protein M404DRAFT_133599 [Pisolithus tinctorius Marx 270]